MTAVGLPGDLGEAGGDIGELYFVWLNPNRSPFSKLLPEAAGLNIL